MNPVWTYVFSEKTVFLCNAYVSFYYSDQEIQCEIMDRLMQTVVREVGNKQGSILALANLLNAGSFSKKTS